ncbi:enoyl-CoA hydratase-related protein, partial [Mycolicibacterium fortuitum]
MTTRSDLPEYRTVRLTVDNRVAVITLDRPQQRNAFGGGMREELAEAYRHCGADDAIRAIVLTGTPPAFCAGADLGAGDQTFTEPGQQFSA